MIQFITPKNEYQANLELMQKIFLSWEYGKEQAVTASTGTTGTTTGTATSQQGTSGGECYLDCQNKVTECVNSGGSQQECGTLGNECLSACISGTGSTASSTETQTTTAGTQTTSTGTGTQTTTASASAQCISNVQANADELIAKNEAQRVDDTFSWRQLGYGCGGNCGTQIDNCNAEREAAYNECLARTGVGIECFPGDEKLALDCANQEVECCRQLEIPKC